MSRYFLLFILNLPIILLGVLGAITKYKLHRISKRQFLVQLFFWITVLISVIMIYPVYNYLSNNKLTNTEPLSLFDVAQITTIVFLLYALNRIRSKTETIERRLNDLHQEISIRLSSKR